jgi:hypothetical protein
VIDGRGGAHARERPRTSREIKAWVVAQLLVVLTLSVAWLATGQTKLLETQRNVDQVRQSLTLQIVELRAATTGGLADVRQQIESLPNDRAQLADLQRRVGEMAQESASTRAGLDARLGTVERATMQLRADLNGLMGNSFALPPDRR